MVTEELFLKMVSRVINAVTNMIMLVIPQKRKSRPLSVFCLITSERKRKAATATEPYRMMELAELTVFFFFFVSVVWMRA